MPNTSLLCALVLAAAAVAAAQQQYTPDQADWSTFYTKPFGAGSSNTAHDPDGVGWISSEDWEEAEWDGTIYNPSKMTREQFVDAICPSVDRIRGIREVFYQHNPFENNANPTKAEVDEWHRIAINHVRALVGYTSEARQVKPDTCLFARALWGDERKFTTQWDDEYPGETGTAYGPCQGSSNAHCGATFVPDAEDQAPYLPPGHEPCGTPGGSEGVFSGPQSDIPWSLKWSRGLCNTLIAEGFWGGHVGPFFHREKVGFSFWDNDPTDPDNNAVLRAKWTGAQSANLYCNPEDADCDPDNTGPMLEDMGPAPNPPPTNPPTNPSPVNPPPANPPPANAPPAGPPPVVVGDASPAPPTPPASPVPPAPPVTPVSPLAGSPSSPASAARLTELLALVLVLAALLL